MSYPGGRAARPRFVGGVSGTLNKRGLGGGLGHPATAAAAPLAPLAPAPHHVPQYAGQGHTLGGSASPRDARAALEGAHEDSVARYKEKELQKQKEKLEKKIARYSHLNISLGYKLVGSEATLEEVRRMQDHNNSEIVNTLRLREMERKAEKEAFPTTTMAQSEEVKDHSTLMREMRLHQQEKYNATVQRKSSTS